MKKILVTGGAGYIGSHTVVELVNAGYSPIIVDNLCNTSTQNIDGIEKIIGNKVKWHNVDCTNKSAMNKVFTEEGIIEGVIHFAAYKSVEESVKNPQKYYDNNIGSLEVLLECMSEHNVKNIIFSPFFVFLSNALPITSGLTNMPDPPPYGVSSTVLCLSSA